MSHQSQTHRGGVFNEASAAANVTAEIDAVWKLPGGEMLVVVL